MMGASVCKPCVSYIGICIQSSSGEGGTYNLRKVDDTKHWEYRTITRSSSINAGSMNISTAKNVNGFWNSWESIHHTKRATKSNIEGSKCQCQPLSKSTHLPDRNISDVVVDDRNISRRYQLGRNLSYNPENDAISNNEWRCISADSINIYKEKSEYSKSQQGEESGISRSSSMKVEFTSSDTVSNNCDKRRFEFSSSSDSETSLEPEYEASPSTSYRKSRSTEILESEVQSLRDSERTHKESANLAPTRVTNVSTGAVPKNRLPISSDQGRSCVTLNLRQLGAQSYDHCFSEEEGKGLHDSKNMTAEVGIYKNFRLNTFNTPTLEKDVPDNGTTLLNNLALSTPRLSTEKDRLKTFKNWSNKNIDPKKLAAAGFYYSGKTDIVECFRCGIKGHNWVENDKPMEDHMRWNKNCPFVRENTTEHDNAQTRQGRDICGNLGVEIFPYSETEDKTEPPESPNLEKLGIRKAKGPSHPDQIIYESRLATFVNWPKSLKQKPAELAAAGFYYLGIGDQTLCFYCGGGLKDWVEEDDPWEQHALWFPKCNYLLMKQNPAFVEAVQNKHKGFLSSKQDEPEDKASCSTSENAKEPPSAVTQERELRNSEDSSTLCKICFKNELGVVFLPCGHMVACIDCASALKECAICRKGIQATVRAFLA